MKERQTDKKVGRDERVTSQTVSNQATIYGTELYIRTRDCQIRSQLYASNKYIYIYIYYLRARDYKREKRPNVKRSECAFLRFIPMTGDENVTEKRN